MYSFNNLSVKKVEANTINEFRNDSAGNYKRPAVLSNIVLNNNRVSLCKLSTSSSTNNSESLLKKNIDDRTKLTTRLSSIEKENIDKLFSIDEDDFGINESSTQIWISQSRNHQDIENGPPITIKEFSSLPTQHVVETRQSSPTSKLFKHYYPESRSILLGSPCFQDSNDFEKSVVNVTDNCFSMSDTNFCRQKYQEQLNVEVEEMDDSIIVISSDDSTDNSIIDSCNIFDDEQGITEEVKKSFTLNNLTSFSLNYEGEEYIKQELNSSIITYNKNASKRPSHMRNEVIKNIEESNEQNAMQSKSFSDCSNSVIFIKDEITHDFYIREETLTPFTPEYFQEPQNDWMTENDYPTKIQSRSLVSDTRNNYLSVLGEKRSCEFSNKTFHLNESKMKSEIDTLETIIKKTATGSTKNKYSKRVSRPSMLSTHNRLHPTKMLSNYSCEYNRAFLRKDLQPVIYIELD